MYGEEAVRITPPLSVVSCNAATTDDVEGPNGECPEVFIFDYFVMEGFFMLNIYLN